MSRNNEKSSGSNWLWTNERHVNFLNSMEASFVHSMLENSGGFPPPLDRYLPDTADSTHDLGKDRRRKPNVADNNVDSRGRRRERKTRNLACQKSSQDQVVPEFENKRDGKDKDDDVFFGTVH